MRPACRPNWNPPCIACCKNLSASTPWPAWSPPRWTTPPTWRPESPMQKKRAPCDARFFTRRTQRSEAVFHVHRIDLGVDVEVVLVDLVVVEVHARAPVAIEIDAGTDPRVTVHAILAVGRAGSVGKLGAKIDVPEEESGARRDVPLVRRVEVSVQA